VLHTKEIIGAPISAIYNSIARITSDPPVHVAISRGLVALQARRQQFRVNLVIASLLCCPERCYEMLFCRAPPFLRPALKRHPGHSD
jgi:hypothetical protein